MQDREYAVLSANGRTKFPDDYNPIQKYLEEFGEHPSFVAHNYQDDVKKYTISPDIVISLKEKFKTELLFEYRIQCSDLGLYKLTDIYIIKEHNILIKFGYSTIDLGSDDVESSCKDGQYPEPLMYNETTPAIIGSNIDANIDAKKSDNVKVIINHWEMYIPNSNSKYYNDGIVKELIKFFDGGAVSYQKNVSNIGMISVSHNEFFVKRYDLDESNAKLLYPDEHYGKGFVQFNTSLISKLRDTSKGLVLLHGEPGTGKTYYIRHLLAEVSKDDAEVLYFPPTMVGSITDPSFITFLGSWIKSRKKKVILLIEDAEPLLENRNSGRNMGITNLLNITDGLLNDCFGVQIIATFNTELKNIDEALLRPGRLIARKEFSKCTIEQLKTLAEKLDKDIIIEKNMTLSEFYNSSNDLSILTHDVTEKNKLAF